MYQRPILPSVVRRLKEPQRFIQVFAGPRQAGKTTLARQVMASLDMPSHYASADEPVLKNRTWIDQQWEVMRSRLRASRGRRRGLLVIDEIQKIVDWSGAVKRLWDEDTARGIPLRVLLLGSSPLLMQKGLTESLAGRFEIIPIMHWSYPEMRDAFGWDLDRYLFFGGYPGSAGLIEDQSRWSRYIIDSLIDSTLNRDILMMTRVDKPALLRRLFELGCSYSGQILSLQKIAGQLQDAGNTTTLAHYLELLESAGLLGGLKKYSGTKIRQRASSPKLLALNTALMTAPSQLTFEQARDDPDFWGRLAESAAGASLANGIRGKNIELYYWSGGNFEVDFVLKRGRSLTAIEVTSGQRKRRLPGIAQFTKEYKVTKSLLVGGQGIPMEEFLDAPVEAWVE